MAGPKKNIPKRTKLKATSPAVTRALAKPEQQFKPVDLLDKRGNNVPKLRSNRKATKSK